MLDPAIASFFEERKEAWRKKNISSGMHESDVREKEQECEQNFLLANWLPDAARRICSRALATHPSKFTHPSTGVGKTNKKDGTYVSAILFEGVHRNDGFVRSGNVRFEAVDSVGNAGELDVEEFLRIVVSDGMTTLQHIERETEFGRALLSVDGLSYEELREGLLAIKSSQEPISTNSKIKQVYFPVGNDGYHLLSTLTHSGHLFEQRKRIDTLRFSEQTKEGRDCRKHNKFYSKGYCEIFGITTIGFGGTKPANVSVLNNQNAGKAHLLASTPPELKPREVRLPRTDFFKESFRPSLSKEILIALHRIFTTTYEQSLIPNRNLRMARDNCIQQYVDLVIEKMWQVRLFLNDYAGEVSTELPLEQKVWLYPEYEMQRAQESEWLDKIVRHISRSLVSHYQHSKFITQPVQLADQELFAIESVISNNKEYLR